MIERDCEQCHKESFTRIKDEQCLACHTLTDHTKSLPAVWAKHPELNFRCETCHIEHDGDDALTARESKLCAGCHGRLKEVFPDTKSSEISSFDMHPQFRVTLLAHPGVAGAEFGSRVSLDDRANLKDPSQIKLNHQVHLKAGLAGPDGPVDLGCNSCHQFAANRQDISPINFEKHCASCHPLEFDPRLPGKSVPHGDPNVVYSYLYAQYAKLFLATEGTEDPNDVFAGRVKPGGRTVERGEKVEYTRTAVDDKSRATESVLFTRTACYVCHSVTERTGKLSEKTKLEQESHYEVLPPKIPEHWLPSARFDHGAHQEVACESCHTDVRKSTNTSDVLLPGISNCRNCHQQQSRPSLVKSECIMCHSYHDQESFPEERKRAIEKILLSLSGPDAKKG